MFRRIGLMCIAYVKFPHITFFAYLLVYPQSECTYIDAFILIARDIEM
jgi:hypothetical protein